ncbi:MAG: response regulator [Spirochaetes bacterium]|nr:response regulator [Spirochaetota bacterium]
MVDPVDVLLIEDNPQDAELTLRAFKKNNLANNIFVIEDGADAVDFLFCKGQYSTREILPHPKIILLDLKLPKIGGLEILKMIKSDQRTKSIPVVIVTSSMEDPDIKTAYEMGANSYVVKPVGFDSFIESIKKLGFYWLLVNKPPK